MSSPACLPNVSLLAQARLGFDGVETRFFALAYIAATFVPPSLFPTFHLFLRSPTAETLREVGFALAAMICFYLFFCPVFTIFVRCVCCGIGRALTFLHLPQIASSSFFALAAQSFSKCFFPPGVCIVRLFSRPLVGRILSGSNHGSSPPQFCKSRLMIHQGSPPF